MLTPAYFTPAYFGTLSSWQAVQRAAVAVASRILANVATVVERVGGMNVTTKAADVDSQTQGPDSSVTVSAEEIARAKQATAAVDAGSRAVTVSVEVRATDVTVTP